jgi:hypothetical protein
MMAVYNPYMRTTIDIHDPLLERAKRYAAERGERLADVVNDALLEKLGRESGLKSAAAPIRLVTFGGGGVKPGVDLSSNASVQEIMDEEVRDPVTGKFDLNRLK